MQKRIIEQGGIWLLASIAFGASYWFAESAPIARPLLLAWKGAGVALLALWAARAGHGGDTRLLAAVMALGALGDVVLDLNRTGGAACFLAGHLVAVWLYLRHRQRPAPIAVRAIALLLLPGVPLAAWSLPADRAAALPTAVYATGLAAMAATAWLSRFPHRSVGAGALLFVASDLLIFARMGPLAASLLPHLLIWPLYYAGQLLIATGVMGSLARADR